MSGTPGPTVLSARPGARRPSIARAVLLVLAVATARASGVGSAPAPGTAPPPPASAPSASKRAATAAAKPPALGAKPAAQRLRVRKSPREMASDARALEEAGAYGQARQTLRELRDRVAPDADLELALALDEARTGQIDSAAARLWSPLLAAALVDSMPLTRRVSYPWQRESAWIDGRFGGWHWYVARARAEVAAAQGRWAEARDAARLAVAARERSGKEWLILAVCAGRAGDLDEAERAARAAVWRDPTLPEAFYLSGLFDWRAGRRAAAQEAFRAAVALDSSYREAALALVRSRLPGVPPDTLPVALLGGPRAVGLLTSPARPKEEEFVQMDVPASIVQQELLPLPDSLQGKVPVLELYLPILVDEHGRAVLHDLPWSTVQTLPDALLRLTLESIRAWRFNPAFRLGKPQRAWATARISHTP